MQGLNLCRSTFLLRFWKYFLGFQILWKKLFETLRIYMDSSLLMLFKKERWSCMFTCDLIGDFERDLLEIFDLILFVDFWLETEKKSVFLAGLIPSSTSPVHILHLLSFFFFFKKSSVIVLEFVTTWWWIRTWIVEKNDSMMKIHHESLRINENLMNLFMNFGSGELGFLLVLDGFWILI